MRLSSYENKTNETAAVNQGTSLLFFHEDFNMTEMGETLLG